MFNKVLVVSIFSLLLLGCSNNVESVVPDNSIEKLPKRTHTSFDTYWGEKKITLPLIEGYQHLTKNHDKEFFDVLNLMEQIKGATNIAFLISNADYIGLISGTRETVEDTYFIIRVQNNLKDKEISKIDFQYLAHFFEKNHKRLMKSNYVNDTVNKNLKKINNDGKLKFKEDFGLKNMGIEPIKFSIIDDKSLMSINLINIEGKDGISKILNISGILHYQDNLLVVITNSKIKGKLTKKVILEKENFSKNYLKLINY